MSRREEELTKPRPKYTLRQICELFELEVPILRPKDIKPNDQSLRGKKVCGNVWMPEEYYKKGEEVGVPFGDRDWFEWGKD